MLDGWESSTEGGRMECQVLDKVGVEGFRSSNGWASDGYVR